MTNNEVLVVIVLGLIGYWGTSALIRFFKKESEWTESISKGSINQEQSQGQSADKSLYEILEVNLSSSLDDSKLASKEKINVCHSDKLRRPDKLSGMEPELKEITHKNSKK